MKKTLFFSLFSITVSSSMLFAAAPGDVAGSNGNGNATSQTPTQPQFNPSIYQEFTLYPFPSLEKQYSATIVTDPLKPVDQPPAADDVVAAYKAFDDFVQTGACSLGDLSDPNAARTPEKDHQTSLALLQANQLLGHYKLALFMKGEENVDDPSHYPNSAYMTACLLPDAFSNYNALDADFINCNLDNPAAVVKIWEEMIHVDEQLLGVRIGDFVADAQATSQFSELQKALSLQQETSSQSGVLFSNQAELARIKDLIDQYNDRYYAALVKRAQFSDEELSLFYKAKAMLSNRNRTCESWPQFHDIVLFESQLCLLEYVHVLLDNREYGVNMDKSPAFLALQEEVVYSDVNNPNELLWVRHDMINYEKNLQLATTPSKETQL